MLQSDTQFDLCYTLNSNIRKLAIFFFLVGGGRGGKSWGGSMEIGSAITRGMSLLSATDFQLYIIIDLQSL